MHKDLQDEVFDVPIGLESLPFVLRLSEILKSKVNNSLEAFRFKVYSPTPLLEERIKETTDPVVLETIKRASELRTQWLAMTGTNLAFWDSISAASLVDSQSDALIQEAVRHDAKSEAREISVEDLTHAIIQQMIGQLPAGSVLGLYSGCRLQDGSISHIPMMDFRGVPSQRHLGRIKKGLQSIGQTKGAIFESGRSYHFYGYDLLAHEEWLDFMGKCLLLAPLIDSRYIAHRLIEGEAALRLSSSDAKPQIPTVIGTL